MNLNFSCSLLTRCSEDSRTHYELPGEGNEDRLLYFSAFPLNVVDILTGNCGSTVLTLPGQAGVIVSKLAFASLDRRCSRSNSCMLEYVCATCLPDLLILPLSDPDQRPIYPLIVGLGNVVVWRRN